LLVVVAERALMLHLLEVAQEQETVQVREQ
jgi:hypothetical protein